VRLIRPFYVLRVNSPKSSSSFSIATEFLAKMISLPTSLTARVPSKMESTASFAFWSFISFLSSGELFLPLRANLNLPPSEQAACISPRAWTARGNSVVIRFRRAILCSAAICGTRCGRALRPVRGLFIIR